MKIAWVSSPQRGETDHLLTEVARRLQAEGFELAGIVKDEGYNCEADNGCDMQVRVLPGGPIVKITQSLGSGSNACRLDPGAIADAVFRVDSGDLSQADLFILNKFGPEEAAGRGFCEVIARALGYDVPVLLGVGMGNVPALDKFTSGMAESLPPDRDGLLSWCRSTASNKRAGAESAGQGGSGANPG